MTIHSFQFPQPNLQVTVIDGLVWFSFEDVVNLMTFNNAAFLVDASVEAVHDDDMRDVVMDSPEGRQEFFGINTSGVYALAGHSFWDAQEFERFQTWVTAKVFPAVNGQPPRPLRAISRDDLLATWGMQLAKCAVHRAKCNGKEAVRSK